VDGGLQMSVPLTKQAHAPNVSQFVGEQVKCKVHATDARKRLVVEDERSARVEYRESPTISTHRPYPFVSFVAGTVAHDDYRPVRGIARRVSAHEVYPRLARLVMITRRGRHDGESHG
jgi:hypothetical protein